MPLEHSTSKEAVARNISREESAGKPRRQSVAIALQTQRDAKKAAAMRRAEKRAGRK